VLGKEEGRRKKEDGSRKRGGAEIPGRKIQIGIKGEAMKPGT